MEIVGVEFEKAGRIYDFANVDDLEIKEGDFVIIETIRGKELGKVVRTKCKRNPALDEDEIKPILKLADSEELKRYEELRQKAITIKPKIQSIARKQKLEIKILDVNYTIDGSKILIEFVAEDRVDFRTFVKKLASEFKAKIELKQIGSRDETKKLGGIGPCGRVCCCNAHLREFDKVAIKMAKNQNISLNPNKINGLCGKLMCCLAYENETYEKMNKTMPKVGAVVSTEFGEGIVMYNDILRQQCTIKLSENDEYKVFPVKDINF
ncbi:MAG: stage 0 sporulation protein [Clostridia bacterium]|nr:stage 0 sporulation protein [Clostridia bacterium]